MRKIPRNAQIVTIVAAGVLLHLQPGRAEDVYNLNQNQSGFTLPGVTLPQGQDEVRAADGTSCRSAASGSGAYFDLGVIQGNNTSRGALATYGRVVIPIGRQPKRIDCTRLYELEVERLNMELRLLKMGLGGGGAAEPQVADAPAAPVQKRVRAPKSTWATEGWTIKGTQ